MKFVRLGQQADTLFGIAPLKAIAFGQFDGDNAACSVLLS